MALTRDFRDTIQARAPADRQYCSALLSEATVLLLGGDVEAGTAVLFNYIQATIGFEQLETETGLPCPNLIRMFGPQGHPQARELFAVIGHVQREAALTLQVAAKHLSF